jgi:hypothetical protein
MSDDSMDLTSPEQALAWMAERDTDSLATDEDATSDELCSK